MSAPWLPYCRFRCTDVVQEAFEALTSAPSDAGPQHAVHRGGRCLQYWGGRCHLPAVRTLEDISYWALQQEPDLDDGLPGRLFVTHSIRPQVLAWGHTSPFGEDLGVLTAFFWWPAMDMDGRAYVTACQVCAQNNDPCTRQQGLLHPLPIPTHPRSHLSLDFISGLLVSQGLGVILILVDQFSKACKFIQLPKLSSAKETMELLLQHIVHTHSFPADLVFDHGPQFASRFWKVFCHLVGDTVRSLCNRL